MNCPKCNKVIQDNAKFCGYCGKSFNKKVSLPSKPVLSAPTPPPQVPVAPVPSNVARCPICGSTSLQAGTKGVSVGKSIAGALLIGPLGLAAGAIGMNDTKIICMNCGNKFTPSE